MPVFVPFVLAGAALVAAGTGVVKAHDGLKDFGEAGRVRDRAARRQQEASRTQARSVRSLNHAASQFGRYKLEVARDTLGAVVEVLEELQRHGKIAGIPHLAGVEARSRRLVAEMKETSAVAASVLAGLARGAFKGACVGTATYGLAGAVGLASTGVAISGLSGAAATSASLAWLGGGSLAAGGFGMAGGTLVLGGIVAAPVMLVGGCVLARQGAEALTQAWEFDGQVGIFEAEVKAKVTLLRQGERRIGELRWAIARIDGHAKRALSRLRGLVRTFDARDQRHTARLAEVLTLARTLKDCLDAPIFGKDEARLDARVPGLIARVRELTP